jgi:hypothetical protein
MAGRSGPAACLHPSCKCRLRESEVHVYYREARSLLRFQAGGRGVQGLQFRSQMLPGPMDQHADGVFRKSHRLGDFVVRLLLDTHEPERLGLLNLTARPVRGGRSRPVPRTKPDARPRRTMLPTGSASTSRHWQPDAAAERCRSPAAWRATGAPLPSWPPPHPDRARSPRQTRPESSRARPPRAAKSARPRPTPGVRRPLGLVPNRSREGG